MSILNSLATTESGGNFAAQNAETGHGGQAGHYGRLQFGHARLTDAMNAGVIPQGTTPEQFMANPEMQQRTEAWHLQDMRNQAERLGLTQYIGQDIGGTPVTMDSILAMGHLGGMGGAKRYLESGGQYNPEDSFGTSLSDYAARHGGASEPARPQPAPQNALAAQMEPEQSARNSLADIRAMLPRQNMLNAADFQINQSSRPVYGFGAGQNPFTR